MSWRSVNSLVHTVNEVLQGHAENWASPQNMVIIHGSVLSGEADEYSDLDCMCVGLSVEPDTFVIKTPHGLLDVAYISLDRLRTLVKSFSPGNNNMHLNALSNCLVVSDPFGVAPALVQEARDRRSQPPPACDPLRFRKLLSSYHKFYQSLCKYGVRAETPSGYYIFRMRADVLFINLCMTYYEAARLWGNAFPKMVKEFYSAAPILQRHWASYILASTIEDTLSVLLELWQSVQSVPIHEVTICKHQQHPL